MTTPRVKVPELFDADWDSVDCRLLRAIALKVDGTLFAWGSAGSEWVTVCQFENGPWTW